MIDKAKKIIEWFQRNERHLSTPIFILGFGNDVITLQLISVSYAVLLFGAYVILAFVCSIAAHYLYVHPDARNGEHWFRSTLRVLFALGAQFFTGGLLSGCLIFYTKSAALTASWPFILLLAVIFIGNEAFRNYRERLAFRSVLFFFTLYAYTIFALPTVVHTMGVQTFLESSAITVGIFIVFIIGLLLAGRTRLMASFREILVGAFSVLILVNVSWFTGIIPPIPLTLRDSGVYHSIVHTTSDGVSEYVVQGEPENRPWWDFIGIVPEQVHYVPGTSLSVYSAVFAPIAFTTGIVHRWQWYDPAKHTWETQAEIAFPIEGGRDQGYRGYSTLTNLKEGRYQVSIETLSGQVIGRLYFDVSDVTSAPTLVTQIK